MSKIDGTGIILAERCSAHQNMLSAYWLGGSPTDWEERMSIGTIVRKSVPFLEKRTSPQKVLLLAMHMYIKRLLDQFGVKIIFDVGANRGQFALAMREIGYTGKIVSFEPLSEQFELLRAEAKSDPLWQVENCALGREAQARDINVTSKSVFASFLEPMGDALPQFSGQNEVVGSQVVEIRRFDDYVRANGLEAECERCFLKSDTQGFDMNVLEGVGDYITQMSMIMVELNCIPIYAGAVDILDMLRFLKSKNFAPVGFFPNNHRGDMAAIEFDYLGINNRMYNS